jgi:hypothetical protein
VGSSPTFGITRSCLKAVEKGSLKGEFFVFYLLPFSIPSFLDGEGAIVFSRLLGKISFLYAEKGMLKANIDVFGLR